MTPASHVQIVRFSLSLALACVAVATPAAGGDFYIGASGAADGLDVLYEKVIDNSSPENATASRGQRLADESSAEKLTYSYGFLAGYKLPLSMTGVYLSLEADMLRHSGVAAARLAGTGASTDNNQLGEVWPEDWSFGQERSYGITGRIGTGIPLIGRGLGPSLYGLVGVRRLRAGFRSDYTGCPTATPCTEPSEFMEGSDSFDETFSGLTYGAGIEQKLGLISVRGEVRVTRYSNSSRVVSFDDLFVSAPLDFEPSTLSFGLALVFYL